MGKRIIQQRRGRGTSTYRIKRKAYKIKVSYPNKEMEGEGKVIKIINSPAHSSPVCLIKIKKEKFFNIAADGIYEGKKINFCKRKKELEEGDISKLKDIPQGVNVFNIENINK